MKRYVIAILLLSTQFIYATVNANATECTRNIPGHYIDRFTPQGDGTVFDNMTGLYWMRCEIGANWNQVTQKCDQSLNDQQAPLYYRFTWAEALDEADKANSNALLQQIDWRLPNIKEIASLQNIACIKLNSSQNDLAIDREFFPKPSATYWSSTPARLKIGTTTTAPKVWQMNFKAGSLRAEATEITTKNAVRLVRGISQ